MNLTNTSTLLSRGSTLLCFIAFGVSLSRADISPEQRIVGRDSPSIFQAWNPIDMAAFPLTTNEDRLRVAAKHDVLWEEPVSQLGFKTPMVLGAVWDNPHGGLATKFTDASFRQALANRRRLLELNPHMILLLEVRWRDAPGSFLPEDSPFWKRGQEGKRILGWDNGPEPYYLLNPDNPDFADNIARQCKVAVGSGIYDGVMFDWSGHIGIVRKTREVLGMHGLIIVNIHDDIADGQRYKDLINGSFMECNPDGPGQPPGGNNRATWDKLRAGYLYMETDLLQPHLNCLEVWGNRDDFRRMRAATTLALTYGSGSVLFGDPNPLPTPDHLHDWYAFWNVKLGHPIGPRSERPDGLSLREFVGGTVVYNHYRNPVANVQFRTPRRRVSDGTVGTSFSVVDADGEIFVQP